MNGFLRVSKYSLFVAHSTQQAVSLNIVEGCLFVNVLQIYTFFCDLQEFIAGLPIYPPSSSAFFSQLSLV